MGKVIGLDYDVAQEHGVAAALLLNELSFWSTKRARRADGWIYKSYDELMERLPLSERTLKRAMETLRVAEIITTKVMQVNGVTRLHYQLCQNDTSGSAKMTVSKESDKMALPYTNTENTHNTGNPEVEKAFEWYKALFDSPRTLLTGGRKSKLAARINTFGLDMVKEAITRTAANGFHRGHNDRGWQADLDFIIRSDEQIERLANLNVVPGPLTREQKHALVMERQRSGQTRERQNEITLILKRNEERYGNK